MKKKAARRKSAKKSPQLSAKPLRELWERLSEPGDRSRLTMMVSSPFQLVPGVPLPPDLEEACRFFASEETRVLVEYLSNPPALRVDQFLEEYELAFEPVDLEDQTVWEVQSAIKRALRIGFNLALLRYADELKRVPEAVRMTAGLQRGRKIAAEVRRKQAAPQRTKHRKRFRELRKSGFSKTQAREVIHQETGISVRQLERDTKGLS